MEPNPMAAYDNMARLYDGMMGMYSAQNPHMNDDIPLYESFATNPMGRYLEVGCGTGRVLMPFLQRGQMMTGVDISDGMLQACRRKTKDYLEAGQLRLLRHNFTEKPMAEPHSGAFVSGCTLNYVPEALQQQFLQNIAASLESGAPIVLDLFHPWSLTNPEIQSQWIEKGSFETDEGAVTLRDKRWMVSDRTERRIQEFRLSDGRVVQSITDRNYIPPSRVKEMLEVAGFKSVSRLKGYNPEQTQDFTETSEPDNFVIVGYK